MAILYSFHLAEHRAERKLWDATLMDGLDDEERCTEDGRYHIH